MEQELIDQIIKRPNAQLIIDAPDFYFQKGQDALKKWLDMELSNDLKEVLLRIKGKYVKIQEEANSNRELEQTLHLFFEIISYCDRNAKDKHVYNKYEDKRHLALAFVRMNSWVEHLILVKLSPDQLPVGSTKNAFNYLLDPENNATVLSENHRELIAKNLFKKDFNSASFVSDLKSYFDKYNLKTTNPANYTELLSRIIYSIEDEWKEEVVALMASDSTGWQDERIEEMEGFEAAVIWNSKRPSGTNETLKFLRAIVEDGKSFNLYYSSGGMVNYRATIIDFTENQEQLDKKAWDKKFDVLYYHPAFADYRDDRKSAAIVFLANQLEKIEPIRVSDFIFYKGWNAPRQDNLSPIKSEPEEIESILNKFEKLHIDMNSNATSIPLNQILFGPPGTGKTYNTISKSLEIIGENTAGKTRQEIKDLFNAKIKEGQIVFTTFHQSMSYEDFIEGIKPIEPKVEGQAVNYKIIDGIFKRACANAAYNSYKLFTKSKTQPDKYSFDDLYEAFTESIQEQIDKQTPPVYKTLKGRDVEVKEINRNDSIIARAKNSIAKSSAPLTKENMQKLYDRFKTIDEIEDLRQVQETVQVTPRITEFYAVFSGLKQFEKTFKPDEELIIESKEVEALDFEELQKKFNAGVYKEAIKRFGKKAEPVVMIIDEINRGNVSQIFGELITLIEEDKRLGKEEALEATLAYSKEKFGVPPNLYIIGTMNTADRSVEALDAALRRRFSFEEMPPKYELDQLQYEFAGIKVYSILETINKRIEKLLDKDHAIGHSYFMLKDEEKPESKMPKAFYKNIIPLLQEYFFGDYGKIGMVLGKGFVRKKEWDKKEDSFAEFDPESSSDFDDRDVYEIVNYTNPISNYSIQVKKDKEERTVEMSFEKAIKLLMKQDIE